HLCDKSLAHDPPLTRRYMSHRLVKQVLQFHLVQVLVVQPKAFGELQSILFPRRRTGRLEGDGSLRRARFHRGQDLFWVQLELFRDFLDRWLPPELGLQALAGQVGTLHRLLETPRHLDRPALVAKVALDLTDDRRRGKGREFESTLRLEALDRLEEADVADLHDVLQRLAAVRELPGQKEHQVVEQLDQLLTALGVFGFLVLEKETANEISIGADRPRRRGCRCLYSIRYLTILIRMLPV